MAEGETPEDQRALERWVGDWAQHAAQGPDTLQRGLTAMILAGMLGRLVDAAGAPWVLLKGGMQMQLRYGGAARPTKDFDVALTEDLTDLDGLLARALRDPYLGFDAVPQGLAEPIADTGAMRVTVKMTYQESPWQSVKLEASRNEAPHNAVDLLSASPDLSPFGFAGTAPVPCLPARYQIAQKLHAVTEVWKPGRDNDRHRDLLDLQLLASEVEGVGASRVRNACLDVFAARGKHAWPPQVRVYPGWEDGYAKIARRIGFPSWTSTRRQAMSLP